jgi:hypothetical protein
MTARPDRGALAAAASLVVAFGLAACSSPAASASSGVAGVTGAPSASASAESASASTEAASTEAASAAASSSPGDIGASPVAAGDACALLPAGDVQTALGVTGLTAQAAALDGSSGCAYQMADGTDVAATTYTKDGGASFDAFKSSQGAIQIPGVADGAYLFDSALYVKKGSASFQFTLASPEDLSPQKLQQVARAIATAVASHM